MVRISIPATDLPQYRSIVALAIECSTSRPNPIKGELRNKAYELFEEALRKTGINKRTMTGSLTGGMASWR